MTRPVRDTVAYVACGTGCDALAAGEGACTEGCIACGACVEACPNGAIEMYEHFARVNRELCSGCGLCRMACPQRVIYFVPGRQNILVSCNNSDKGAVARKICPTSCIACGMCAKKCPANAIAINDNCAAINGMLCLSCGMCAVACPHGVIRDRRGILAPK